LKWDRPKSLQINFCQGFLSFNYWMLEPYYTNLSI